MPAVILRPLHLRIDERGHKPAAVRDRQLQRARRRALVVAGGVARVPDEDARHGAVQARRHQERHAVLGAGEVGAQVRDRGVPDDGQREHEQHERAAQVLAVGEQRHDDGDDRCDGIGGDGEELRGVGGVAELEDDGRQEEAEGVEAGEDAEVGGGGEPDFWVEDAAEDL